jgi:predicted GIY-YIG superfamily endonuclease
MAGQRSFFARHKRDCSGANALSKRSAPKGQTLPDRVYAYLLKCSDGSLYAGSTSDLQARIDRHNAGRAATWTKARLPVELAYFEAFSTIDEAIRRERQWKRWTHAKKEALIAGDVAQLKALSKNRTQAANPSPVQSSTCDDLN